MQPPEVSWERPRLAPHAPVVPIEGGWIAPGDTGSQAFEPPVAPADPDGFLDLLDGANDPAAIAGKAGIPRPAVEAILRRFFALGLLDAGEPPRSASGAAIPTAARIPAWPGPPAGASRLPPVLLAGLGEPGVAVLRELAGCEGAVLHVFDPAPVEAGEGPPFRPGDAGRERAGLVVERLGPEARARLEPVGCGTATAAAAHEALGAAVARAGLVVCCLDRPSHLPLLLSEQCHAEDVPLVIAVLEPDGASLVPQVPGVVPAPGRGCARCWLHHRDGGDAFAWSLARHVRRRFPRPARWRWTAPPGAVDALAQLAVLGILRAVDASRGRDHPDARMLRIDREAGRATPLRIPGHPGCRRCHPIVARSAAELRDRIARRWEEESRRDPVPTDLAVLRSRLDPLVGSRHGLLGRPSRVTPEERERVARLFQERGVDPRAAVVPHAHVSTVARPVTDGRHTLGVTALGLDFHDARRAEALGIVEALERLFALDLWDPERVVRARHDDVAGRALDPRELPLFAEEQYREPDFPLEPFRPEQEIDWLWGIRVAREEPVLVPRDLVFTSRPSTLWRPTSNGAACHSSLLHAVLNGVYETVERDALMVAWLGRLSLPRLALGPEDPDPLGLRRELEALGFELRHVDLTTDLGIPVTLGVLRDRRNPDFVMLDMAAGLETGARLGKLYRELVQFTWPYLLDPDFFRGPATGSWEPEAVADFPDHVAFYQDRTKHRLLDFLDASPTTRPLEAGAGALPVDEELRRVVSGLEARGHPVLAVDCTHRFLDRLGLHAVKVLIPGLVPLNAGHRFRVLGGSRARRLPAALGLADGPLDRADLNPWPHPFW